MIPGEAVASGEVGDKQIFFCHVGSKVPCQNVLSLSIYYMYSDDDSNFHACKLKQQNFSEQSELLSSIHVGRIGLH